MKVLFVFSIGRLHGGAVALEEGAAGLKVIGHRQAQQHPDAVDGHFRQRGPRCVPHAPGLGVFQHQGGDVGAPAKVLHQRRRQTGQGKAQPAGRGFRPPGSVVGGEKETVQGNKPGGGQSQHQGVALDVGRQQDHRQGEQPGGQRGAAHPQPESYSPAEEHPGGHVAQKFQPCGAEQGGVPRHRKQGGHQQRGQQKGQGGAGLFCAARHGGTGGQHHKICGVDGPPGGKVPEILEEVAHQGQPGQFGHLPGQARVAQGIQLVVVRHELGGGAPGGILIKIEKIRLQPGKVHCQQHRQHPEHLGGGMVQRRPGGVGAGGTAGQHPFRRHAPDAPQQQD